jgi:hypothetical protein
MEAGLMGVEVVWENEEKTVLRFIYLKGWTWDDVYTGGKQAREMMDSASSPVVQIIDFTKGGVMPSGVPVHFRNMQKMLDSKNNSGITVVLAGSTTKAFVNSFIKLFRQTFPDAKQNAKWFVVDNLDDAKKLAAEKANEFRQ